MTSRAMQLALLSWWKCLVWEPGWLAGILGYTGFEDSSKAGERVNGNTHAHIQWFAIYTRLYIAICYSYQDALPVRQACFRGDVLLLRYVKACSREDSAALPSSRICRCRWLLFRVASKRDKNSAAFSFIL